MNYVCAWCKKPLPTHKPDGDERVSHGICEPCVDEYFPGIASEFHAIKAAA